MTQTDRLLKSLAYGLMLAFISLKIRAISSMNALRRYKVFVYLRKFPILQRNDNQPVKASTIFPQYSGGKNNKLSGPDVKMARSTI